MNPDVERVLMTYSAWARLSGLVALLALAPWLTRADRPARAIDAAVPAFAAQPHASELQPVRVTVRRLDARDLERL